MIYGIDVSHHQNPNGVPWAAVGAANGFAICRASYGSALSDRWFLEHVSRARQNRVHVGAYHFFRPSQPWPKQAELFLRQLRAAGFGPGDIIPWIDIEDDPIPKNQPVTPMWDGACEEFCRAVDREYGQCGVYITRRGWKMLGSPEWVLERPLWVAHYTSAAEPATPGDGIATWTMWQHRVGPFELNGPGGYFKDHPDLDQNRAKFLPLIVSALPSAPEPPTDDSELERLLNYADFLQVEAGREMWDEDTTPGDA